MTILSKEELSSEDLKVLRDLYWTLVNEAEKRYECNDCKSTRVKGNGWSNLDSHLFGKHGDWLDKLEVHKKSNASGFVFYAKAGDEAKNLHGWLEWMVMNDESPTFCENKYVKKNTKLQSITSKTLLKYAYKLNQRVKTKLSEELPKTFGLIFDGWTMAGEHYIAVFATWVTNANQVIKRLLCCGVQDLPDEEAGEDAGDFGFTADDIGDYLFDVLESYGKCFECIEFMSGDNAYVNGALCDKLQNWLKVNKDIDRIIPLVGCACHRLNLAVKQLYKTGTVEGEVVKKIHNLMVVLSTMKNSYKLTVKTRLRPEVEQDTRWGSTFHMLLKYLRLQPILPDCAFDNITRALFLSAAEDDVARRLCENLKQIEIRSKFLQGDYCDVDEEDDDDDIIKQKAEARDNKKKRSSPLTLFSVRLVFDQLLEKFDGMKSHLAANAPIVHNKDFENAVVKIQSGKEATLNRNEKNAMRVFLLDDETQDEEAEEVVEYAVQIQQLEEAAKAETAKKCKYRSLDHIAPTSVIVERLFSRAKLIMTPHRRCMDPSTLEMLLLLRYGKDLWSESTVDEVLRELAADRLERRRAREEQEAQLRQEFFQRRRVAIESDGE